MPFVFAHIDRAARATGVVEVKARPSAGAHRLDRCQYSEANFGAERCRKALVRDRQRVHPGLRLGMGKGLAIVARYFEDGLFDRIEPSSVDPDILRRRSAAASRPVRIAHAMDRTGRLRRVDNVCAMLPSAAVVYVPGWGAILEEDGHLTWLLKPE